MRLYYLFTQVRSFSQNQPSEVVLRNFFAFLIFRPLQLHSRYGYPWDLDTYLIITFTETYRLPCRCLSVFDVRHNESIGYRSDLTAWTLAPLLIPHYQLISLHAYVYIILQVLVTALDHLRGFLSKGQPGTVDVRRDGRGQTSLVTDSFGPFSTQLGRHLPATLGKSSPN